VLAIALDFCLLYAIGLGTIDTAVRLRNCDCALASRIGTLSLTMNIHLSPPSCRKFTKRLMHDKGHIALGRKADKGQFRLRYRQRLARPAWRIFVADKHVSENEDSLIFGNREITMIQGVKLLVEPLRSTTTGCKHSPHVPRNCCSRACQPRLDRSVWNSEESGCLKD
jgi:hypothetical protein